MGGLSAVRGERGLPPAPSRQVRWGELRQPHVLVYSVASGVFATALGALASLGVEGTARIALWGTVTSAAAVASGLVHDSRPVTACLSGLRRRIHWTGRH